MQKFTDVGVLHFVKLRARRLAARPAKKACGTAGTRAFAKPPPEV